jgi:hypothetical protein
MISRAERRGIYTDRVPARACIIEWKWFATTHPNPTPPKPAHCSVLFLFQCYVVWGGYLSSTLVKSFLGVFAISRKATVSFMSVCPSARPRGITRLLLDEYLWDMIFKYFSKICREYFIKILRKTGTLHEDMYIEDNTSLNSPWNEKCFRQKL